jgi:predicted AlkP superfamily phosphohydrolase/phosphomutase
MKRNSSSIASSGRRVFRHSLLAIRFFTLLSPGLLITGGCSEKEQAAGRKVFVLGCDGMDPKLVGRMMAEGRLPNFSRLAAQGAFRPLTTSVPPQSPVAWSNFITGADPGVHGIFDFIHRDPAQQALPYFSTNRIIDQDHKEPWTIGKYVVPRGAATNELLRRGTPFWDYLDSAGVSVQMYHLPANYPPSKSAHGHACCLSGMGVPDAMGKLGVFQQFTSYPRPDVKSDEGMKLRLRWDQKAGALVARLQGPANEFLPKAPPMTLEVQIHPDKKNDVAKLVYVNKGVVADETKELVLNVGAWSDWTELRFLKTPIGPSFGTMARFYLKALRPEIDLFVTPLNFIPTAPEIVFSEPAEFVREIGEGIGPFYTQGFAEQFNARKQEILSDEEYRIQADQVLDDSMKMLDYALDRFEEGVLFFYFSSTDLQAHIFWWEGDEKHPVRSPENARKYQGVIENLYVKIDEALGRCRKRLGDETTILVMSDHGFCNFRRCFGLNTWLREQGYLVAPTDLFADADWKKTRAYGLGLNGLYLNLRGRERDGIVEASQRDALLREISEKLLAVRDPENGKPVIRRVYRTDECYHGPEAKNAPDLIIGYDRDYRASWNTCLGRFDSALVIDNTQPWSADHCIAHDLVPGVLISNRKISVNEPALIDVAPTILSYFGVSIPKAMSGRDLFPGNHSSLADAGKGH